MQNNLAAARVLVVGDIMLDRYYYGLTHRISPEAPVPVVHVTKTTNSAGGAGNVALNIAALLGEVAICSLVGNDEAADSLSNTLSQKNIKTYFTQTNLPTITKLRVLSQQQQLLRLDFEQGFSAVDKSPLLSCVKRIAQHYNVLVLSDYGKGTLSDINALIDCGKSHNMQILIDPKGNDFTRYHGASLVTPNRKEFEAVVGQCHCEDEIKDKALRLINKHQLGGLLITRSEKGMTLVLANEKMHSIPAFAKDVFDVTGAGDTVIAVMAMALSSGHDAISAMHLANAAASVVVGKVGSATLTNAELYHAMHHQMPIDKGILTQTAIIQAMKTAHLQGEKIVMTNGCFDILHAGHVEYLQRARALGDRLIVAVNSDNSVRRLKGKARPVVPLDSRMKLLSALACVDWVIAFDEDTPENLINTLLPDILVKGDDYQINEIAGHNAVLANGGEVKTLSLKPDHSTSSIITKIRSQAE